MASAAREYRYAHREFSTNGSLARDLDWAVRERELEHAGEVPRHERTQAAPKVYHKEQVLVRERQALPVLSVLGVTAVAVAAVMLLLSYVQLTTLAADTVALKSELTVLQAENVSLTAQHEQMFDMATVKEVAAAAEKYMGLSGFAPDESYLGPEGYFLPGRAARSMPHLLLWPSYGDSSGRTLVKAEIYSDHLNVQNCQGYLFAFYPNGDGSLRLASVK